MFSSCLCGLSLASSHCPKTLCSFVNLNWLYLRIRVGMVDCLSVIDWKPVQVVVNLISQQNNTKVAQAFLDFLGQHLTLICLSLNMPGPSWFNVSIRGDNKCPEHSCRLH